MKHVFNILLILAVAVFVALAALSVLMMLAYYQEPEAIIWAMVGIASWIGCSCCSLSLNGNM